MDQAAGLRQLAKPKAVSVVAITGGKGGIGKTSLALNLGTALCLRQRRVMVLDADLGLANLDVQLGLRARFNLEHVINADCSLEDIILTASSGLRVVPASSGSLSMANLNTLHQVGLINAFSELLEPLDVLLIDTAAGLSESVVTFSSAANRVVVVVVDEPSSLTDAYGLIKVLSRRHSGIRVEVIANMTRELGQGRLVYEKLARVTHRFLGVGIDYLGSVPYDDYVHRAVQKQVPVVERFPGSRAARAITRLAERIEQGSRGANVSGGVQFFLERMLAADRGLAGRISV
jgi:flagellar biosynthesis protein FlhG